MKKIYLGLPHKFSLLILTLPLFAISQNEFDVGKISLTLKIAADAVIRVDETVFSVRDAGHADTKNKKVVTIFNERGNEKYAKLLVGYDKLNKIRNISGTRYDEKGSIVEKIKSKNIIDVGISSFGNDVMDGRVKIADFDKKQTIYPYTIEYNWEIETSNMMFYPAWYPYGDEHTSVEKATLTINAPTELSFRYKEISLSEPVKITEKNKYKTYTWDVENLPAYENEVYSPPFDRPSVITAPINFEVEGYKGAIHTWEDISKFVFELNKGRDELPEAVKAKVKALVKDEKDSKIKIKKLYEYLQSNTRYMNISLGIGGWQTMPATEVAAKGYGDCKALSNFMKALLQEAGIPAYQALVYAGDDIAYCYPDFPTMHFNHVITCVPLEKDTLFLECTSQTNPFGYQGSFTGNRKALLIKPEGGKLINTAAYLPSDNKQVRKANVLIDEAGGAKVSISSTYSGIQQEDRDEVMHQMNQEEQKHWVIDHVAIPSFDLQEFSFSADKKSLPTIEENLKLTVRKIVAQSGSRLFITPNLMTTFLSVPVSDKERMASIYLNPNAFNFNDIDTVTYQLPANYVLEFAPETAQIKSKFGEYTARTIVKDGTLMYYRSVTVSSNSFPKEDYNAWVEFIKKVSKSDKANVVFTLKKN